MSQTVRLLVLFMLLLAGVQQVEAVETGKRAAMKYFTGGAKKQIKTRQTASISPTQPGHRILALAVGSLVNSRNYNEGQGQYMGWNAEAFYLKADQGYFAKGYHLEMQKFSTHLRELTKLSFLLSFSFPRRLSFPVYLGVAAGPGFFLKQNKGKSQFSFDYKAYLGLRLNQENSQYFLQTGVKNHVLVLSDGQFVGWFVSSGVAYTF